MLQIREPRGQLFPAGDHSYLEQTEQHIQDEIQNRQKNKNTLYSFLFKLYNIHSAVILKKKSFPCTKKEI